MTLDYIEMVQIHEGLHARMLRLRAVGQCRCRYDQIGTPPNLVVTAGGAPGKHRATNSQIDKEALRGRLDEALTGAQNI